MILHGIFEYSVITTNVSDNEVDEYPKHGHRNRGVVNIDIL